MRKLSNAATVYTVLGLVGGVYYRELTKAHSFTGVTQLAFVHTHFLALGTLFFLVALALEKPYRLTSSQWFPLFFAVYQIGLVLTAWMFLVHGTLTVLERHVSPVVPWVAGLGHISLAMGLAFFLLALRERVAATSDGTGDDGAALADGGPAAGPAA